MCFGISGLLASLVPLRIQAAERRKNQGTRCRVAPQTPRSRPVCLSSFQSPSSALCAVSGASLTLGEKEARHCQPQGPGLAVSDGSLPGFASENELS